MSVSAECCVDVVVVVGDKHDIHTSIVKVDAFVGNENEKSTLAKK